MSDKACNVDIEINGVGRGSVIIDGHDWSHRLNKIEYTAEAGRPSVLQLTILNAKVRVTGSSLVTTQLPTTNENETDDGKED